MVPVFWELELTCRVALIIQIQLAQNNIEGAEKTLAGVKSWAQDTLLQQLAEVFHTSCKKLTLGLGWSSEGWRCDSRSILHL